MTSFSIGTWLLNPLNNKHQSNHWYQWTIGWTNRIRLCILDVCATFARRSRFCGGFRHVALNFLFQLIFVFPLFLGAVMYANEFETKKKQKLIELKNYLQHTHQSNVVIIRTYDRLNWGSLNCFEKFNDTDRTSKDAAGLIIRAVKTTRLRTKPKKAAVYGQG